MGKSLAFRAWEQEFTAALPSCPVCGERPTERFRLGQRHSHAKKWVLGCAGELLGVRHLVRVSHVDRAIARQAWCRLARPSS